MVLLICDSDGIFMQHCKIKYIYLQHLMNVQLLMLQILILQHSNHINSHVWWICPFVLTMAVFSGSLSTISHTNSGRLISGTEMSAYGDLTTFSSGVGKLRPQSLLTRATGHREATAPYVCLITLQPSRKLLQLFIVLTCRTYTFAAVRHFRIYCAVCQNILLTLSENTSQFIRTHCAVCQKILHSLSENIAQFIRTNCVVFQNILHSLSEHTAILLEYTAQFIRTYCHFLEYTAHFIRTYYTVYWTENLSWLHLFSSYILMSKLQTKLYNKTSSHIYVHFWLYYTCLNIP
jgi:hypothetical protein